MKTLLNAGKTSILELKNLLSKQIKLKNVLIKNNVKYFNSRSQSAEVCKLICSKSFNKINGIRQFSSTASQRLNAKDMAWLVGFVEGEGCFTIYKSLNNTNNTVSFEISQTNGLQILSAIKTSLSR